VERKPLFRTFRPTTAPARTFPNADDLRENRSSPWEVLPDTGRTLSFRVTVRGHHGSLGTFATESTALQVVDNSGPFLVTEPPAGASWNLGSQRQVRWEVANTAAAPVSCERVRISVSTDAGRTWREVSTTENDGQEPVNIPADLTPTVQARVKVEAVGNIFFDISDGNFTIAR
jgi:hypothetical protein